MNTDFIERAIADSQPQLLAQLQSVFGSLAAGIDKEKLSTAIRKQDRAAVMALLGIIGDTWPQLERRLQFAFTVELVPVYSAVVGDVWESLGEDSEQSLLDRAEFDAMLKDARDTVSRDARAGAIAAIGLVIRYGLEAPQLLACIGLTSKQALIYVMGYVTATRIQAKLSKLPTIDARATALRELLAKLPALIATRIRRQANDRGSVKFTEDDVRLFSKQLAKQFQSYRYNALATQYATTAANLSELMVWKDAKRRGIIADDTRKFWVTRHDERVRHSHAEIEAMNADGVPVEGTFKNPLGITLSAPPAELNCRCRVSLGSPSHGNGTNAAPPLAGVNA